MILVTGASGFVGAALLQRLANEGRDVRAAYRIEAVNPPVGVQTVSMGNLGSGQDWHVALQSIHVVIHAAARVHVMRDTATDPLTEFREANTAGTLNLARQAAEAGVRRFVFISSVKVHGEANSQGHPFTEDDALVPKDPYGQSKLEAEQGLWKLAAQTGMELCIIRPPLVYGPGVRANFAALVRAVAHGLPLPLASVDNRRSMVALDNLLDLIVICADHPAAVNQTFLVSDGHDLSTPALIRGLAQAMGKSSRLFACPPVLLQFVARVLGKANAMGRLCGNLQVDITKAQTLLGWQPPVSVEEGLRRAVSHNTYL